jgi:hypothetical protein
VQDVHVRSISLQPPSVSIPAATNTSPVGELDAVAVARGRGLRRLPLRPRG